MNLHHYRNIFPVTDHENPVTDGHSTVTYGDIPLLLEKIDAAVNRQQVSSIHCVALFTENAVAHTLFIIYLLTKKINFFLISGYSPVHQSIPAFCDWIVQFNTSVSAATDPSAGMQWQRNTAHQARTFPETNEGFAFFASSGTSGKPKYIRYGHTQLLNNAANIIKRFGIGTSSRVLVPVPVSHMYGMGVGWLPALTGGAGLCLIERNNIIKLIEQIAGFQPSLTLLTPAVTKMMLQLNKRIANNGSYLTAGEKITAKTLTDFENRFGTLYNLYGSSEMGAMAVSPDEAEAQYRQEGAVYPLEGVQLVISNGEILCRHAAAFDGYVNSEGHFSSPCQAVNSWFPTNDAGLQMGDCIKVLGRKDNCINRSGFLVSLDEMSAGIENQFPEINQAVVFEASNHENLSPTIIAICELVAGMTLDVNSLKTTCRHTMNKYLVPDEFYIVPGLPRLPNGKVDRNFLINNYQTIVK